MVCVCVCVSASVCKCDIPLSACVELSTLRTCVWFECVCVWYVLFECVYVCVLYVCVCLCV